MPTQRQTARRETISKELWKAQEGLTAREISKLLGIHYTTANDDLNVLLHAGKVRSTGGPQLRTERIWQAV